MRVPLRVAGTTRTRAGPALYAVRKVHVACLAFCPNSENKEDAMPHFMIRWQFTSTSAKALVGKPLDRSGAAKALVEGFGG